MWANKFADARFLNALNCGRLTLVDNKLIIGAWGDPWREIGEAEIFEHCVCYWSAEPDLLFFVLSCFFLLFGLRKSRGHGHSHGWPGAKFGKFEAFLAKTKPFQNEIQ